MGWQDLGRRRSSRRKRDNNRVILAVSAVLVLINIAVILYHGDPRRLLDQVLTAPPKLAQRMRVGVTPQVPARAVEVASKIDLLGAKAPTKPLLPQSPRDLQIAVIGASSRPPYPFDPTVGLRSSGSIRRITPVRLQKRQTLSSALGALGLSASDTHAALTSLGEHTDLRRLRTTDTIKTCWDEQDRLVAIEVHKSATDQVKTTRETDRWHSERVHVAIDKVLTRIVGRVQSSLWDALVQAGEDPRLVVQLVDVFAYEVDFYTEVQPGDSFVIVVDKQYAESKFLGYGQMIAVELKTSGEAHRAFLYQDSDTSAYFDGQGRAMRKQLLRTPLKYGPVTSGFGVRHHPVLGYTRAHNGTDYGVAIGTPVWSVGDGRVVRAGFHGGYGKLVEVAHPNGWLSQYAHLSKILVKVGARVHQKDLVGLVGQTGLATGPHLHYGLKRNGHYVNSLTQNFERARPLTGQALQDFLSSTTALKQSLAGVDPNYAAPLSPEPAGTAKSTETAMPQAAPKILAPGG